MPQTTEPNVPYRKVREGQECVHIPRAEKCERGGVGDPLKTAY